MPAREAVQGIAVAALLVAAMVAVFVYETQNAPEVLGASGAADADAPREAVSLPYAATGCGWVEAFVEVPVEAVAPHVPPGFEVVPSGTTGGATVQLGGLACEAFTLANATDAGGRAHLSVAVRPAADSLVADEAGGHFFMIETYVTNGSLAAFLDERGAPHAHAESVETDVATAGSHLWIRGDGLGHHVLAPASPPQPPQATGSAFTLRAFHAAEGGLVVEDLTLRFDGHAGFAPGTYETPEGTLAREILGASGRGLVGYGAGLVVESGAVAFVPTEASDDA